MSTVFTNVGAPGTVGSASGGRTYAYNNLSTTPEQVIGANPQRQVITVHNPGAVTAYIAPVYVQNGGSDTVLTPSPTALGGCYAVPAYSTWVISGECQKAYQAFSASGSGNPLTVVESNV